MAIQNKPFTLFQEKGLETRNRSLRFDMNAMSDFEQLTGMGLAQLMATRAVFAATRALLWAGLKHQDRGLTIDRVGQLMQDYVHDKDGTIDQLLETCILAAIDQKAIPDNRVKDADGEDGSIPNAPASGSSPTTGISIVPGPVTSGPSSLTPLASSD